MGQLVSPKVYLVGFTDVHEPGLKEYLQDTGQMEFWDVYRAARDEGISGGEALCSFYAKLCYKSLVEGKNANVTKIRNVKKNLEGCHDTGHGSVFEHCNLNFIVTNCSRVYTHEQVRQRAGWAYSQTSGRYCRLDSIDLVWSKLLDPVQDLWMQHLRKTEELVYLSECATGLRKPNPKHPYQPPEMWMDAIATAGRGIVITPDDWKWVPDDSFDFNKRKAITSAIRRIAPNGQANEMGMTANIRALRHVVQLRTSRHSETEIRDVFAQVYNIVKEKFPTVFYKARTKVFDGIPEIFGMKSNPYDLDAGDPKALEFYETSALEVELARRNGTTAGSGPAA